MRTIKRTSQFKRDYKRESRDRHWAHLDAGLAPIIETLANDQPLEPRHHDNALSGEWGDHRECHVKPDVFVYRGDSTSADVGAEFFLNSHAEAY